ncbi:hypothetical protein SAMN05216516_12016 [Izhakiella capsodis]|uniref:Uncharacterized protein n=1 Tax=Izhakiella capsodis TaxID=1367852 RepID=A0A1I5BQ63_9GAMM|nr:hypothetical protein [Izhakiella capsodis]SFN76840.1 hypothetical protein SAMN05216516_12016 [Izhakiella capsodis]
MTDQQNTEREAFERWFYSDYNEDLHAKLIIQFAESIAWKAWQERAEMECEYGETNVLSQK